MLEGPVDIVGDIHGEFEALQGLLTALGYDARGEHRGGRRLVFLGDLCDRGPDSPAVINLVRDLVARGLAQCVLGNHELNLLRKDEKHGNRWYLNPAHDEQGDEFKHSKPAPEASKSTWHEFFLTLPLALERADLRVVHAAWNADAIEKLRATDRSVLETLKDHERSTDADCKDTGLALAADEEEQRHRAALTDRTARVPLLANLAKRDEVSQMKNPVRITTSGPERVTDTPFWSGGKWRMCDRVRWWNEYTDTIPVIFGHYWRSAHKGPDVSGGKPDLFSVESESQDGLELQADVCDGKPDLFSDHRHNEWLGTGADRNVFCVDFSVGKRYRERARPRKAATFANRLAAVRWPEQELVFDDGTTIAVTR